MYMDIKTTLKILKSNFRPLSWKKPHESAQKAKRKIMKLIHIYICRLLINMCSKTAADSSCPHSRETAIIMHNKVSPSFVPDLLCRESDGNNWWVMIWENFNAIKSCLPFLFSSTNFKLSFNKTSRITFTKIREADLFATLMMARRFEDWSFCLVSMGEFCAHQSMLIFRNATDSFCCWSRYFKS